MKTVYKAVAVLIFITLATVGFAADQPSRFSDKYPNFIEAAFLESMFLKYLSDDRYISSNSIRCYFLQSYPSYEDHTGRRLWRGKCNEDENNGLVVYGALTYDPEKVAMVRTPERLSFDDARQSVLERFRASESQGSPIFESTLRGHSDQISDQISEYKNRIGTIRDRISASLNADISLFQTSFLRKWDWRSKTYSENFAPVSIQGLDYDVSKELRVVCDDLFSKKSSLKIKMITAMLKIEESTLCKGDYDKEIKKIWTSMYALDAESLVDESREFVLSPYAISHLPMFFGVETPSPSVSPSFGDLEGYQRVDAYKNYMRDVLGQISIGALYEVYYGVEFPIPHNFFVDFMKAGVYEFLFDESQDSREGIVKNAKRLSPIDFYLMNLLLDKSSLSDKERRILSIYESEIDVFQESENSLVNLEESNRQKLKESEYLKLYAAFKEVETCYLGRQGYSLVYVNDVEWGRAKKTFEKKRGSLNLTKSARERIEKTFDESTAGKMLNLVSQSGANFNNEQKNECDLMLLALQTL